MKVEREEIIKALKYLIDEVIALKYLIGEDYDLSSGARGLSYTDDEGMINAKKVLKRFEDD
jgi:hypothetical protein